MPVCAGCGYTRPIMRTLITGGAGFIGSHLTELLLDRGHEVVVLDDFSTGKQANLPRHPALTVIEGDVVNAETAWRAVQDSTAVVHLAAVASVQASVEHPLETHRTNLTGTVNMLQAAALAGATRFLYASTAAVYGNPGLPAGTRLSEDHRPAPLTPYAIDKLAGEQYVRWFAAEYGVMAHAFRFFNVYGERQDPRSPYSGVISIFSDRLRTGRPVTVFGDGRQTRDFVYVRDVARVLAAALERGQDQAGFQVLNLGTGTATDLLTLLSTIGRITGSPADVRMDAPRAGDVRHSLADSTRLRGVFPEIVFTPLEKGLEAVA